MIFQACDGRSCGGGKRMSTCAMLCADCQCRDREMYMDGSTLDEVGRKS